MVSVAGLTRLLAVVARLLMRLVDQLALSALIGRLGFRRSPLRDVLLNAALFRFWLLPGSFLFHEG